MKSRLVYLISALLLPYCAVTSQSVSLHFNLETNQSIVLNTKELGKPNWVTYRFESGLTVAISEKTPCVISVNNPYYLPYVDTIFDAGVYYINLIRNDIELPSIVITGELEKSTTDSAIFDIQVINQKGFNKTASNTVKDALQFNSAINTFDDNAIGNSIEINGLSANNIKVLRDGVPLTGRVFRNIDLSQLNLNNVERIEIVEGPQVVAYGADALAGTINIISKIDAPSQVYGSIYSESVGVINTAIGGVASAGNTSISLDAARHYFDGIDFNDSTRSLDWNRKEQYFISPSLIFNPNKSLQIGAFTNYTSEKITAFGDVRTNGRSAFDNYFDTKRVDNRLFLNQKVSSASSINAQLAYNTFVRTKKEVNFNLLSTETTLTAPSNQDTQLSTRYYGKLMYNTKFRTINSDFVLGVEEDFEMGDGTRLNDSTTNQISNFSVFSGIKKSFQNGLAVQPGVRLISNSLYGFQIAPAINVRYVNNHYTYRFSFAEGVRNPSINELYFRFVDVNHDVLGNPNLEPETSQYYSFSVKHKKVLNKTIIKTDFSLFTNQSKKLIQLVSTNPNSLEFTYLNLNSYDVYGNSLGVEVKQNKLEFYVSNSLLLKENFGNTNTKAFILSSNLQSLVSYTIPVIKIKSTVSYRLFINPTKLSIDLTGETSQQVLANFQFLDLNFTKSFSKDQFRLGFGVKNLVNTTSADVTSGSVNSIHGAQAQQSLSYGRTFHISLKYQLTKNDNE